ncbi:hypothetical protein AZF37_07625 [endosymbiont 'TC1' of Trimyema compressum]|nr:hypothetical protein AZF37_07625 [endosymbiont 'TC1' of Trimyema compressum]
MLVNQDNPLPNNYAPTLATHSSGYLVDERIVSELDKMLNDGIKDGVSLLICSACRSIEKQTALFNDQVSGHKEEGLSKEEAI